MENNIDTDQAYILGLIVGGGIITNNRLVINLPYRNWGSLKVNPGRAGEISEYIIKTLKPIWKNSYNSDISYTVDVRSWQIFCELNEQLKESLKAVGLPTSGTIKETANIKILSEKLNNATKIKRFIAGLTDTIGSLAKSHRHRVDTNQIISFEFSGKNFKLIADLVNLFEKIGCYPDQVLWNHPNFHSSNDRYYPSWRKGFKLRIRLYDYMLKGNFVSEAKRLSAEENALLQRAEEKSLNDKPSINGRTTLHMDEYSEWLPSNVRGLHYIHYSHMLYVLGGAVSAEMYEFLNEKLEHPELLFVPFTMLTKGEKKDIYEIIQHEDYLKKSTYSDVNFSIYDFQSKLDNKKINTVYGIDEYRGFPKNQVQHAITYVVLAQMGSDKLKGKRVLGKIDEVYKSIRNQIDECGVKIKRPDRGTCLLIETKDYAALVGFLDDELNKKLVSVDKKSLKMTIRNPRFEECPVLL